MRRPNTGLEMVACVDMQVAENGATATLTAHRIPPTEPVRIAQAVQAYPLIRRSRDVGAGAPARRAGVVATGLRDATFVMELLPDEGDGEMTSNALWSTMARPSAFRGSSALYGAPRFTHASRP